MDPRRFALWSSCALFLAGSSAHAEVFVGRYGALGDPDIVRVFATADGDEAPVRLLGGPATLLQGAGDLVYEPLEEVLYVSDFFGQAIRVFLFGAQGNVPPLRSFTNGILGQPRDLVVVPAYQEILAVASSCCVATFYRFASGPVAALRFLAGGLTGLTNPTGLAYRPATDEIYVGDGGASGGKVLVFPRTAAGDVAPSRVIAGSNTQLASWVLAVAVHPVLPEVYVLATDGNTNAGRIVTFHISASGNATPGRVIAGNATLLQYVRSLDYDVRRDEFVVLANTSGGGNPPRVLRFSRTAQGDVAPNGDLSGPSTGLADIVSVMVVTPDGIFLDGFNAGP